MRPFRRAFAVVALATVAAVPLVRVAAARELPTEGRSWQTLAPIYDAKVDKEERSMGMASLRRELCRNLHGDVLEVAAGTGRNAAFIAPQVGAVKRVVFLDNSDQMIAALQRKLSASPELQAHAVALVADAQALPIADASFDFVLSSFSLCSVDLPLTQLHEMARVAKPGAEIRLLEHGRTWFTPLNMYLDRMHDTHKRNWGCSFNRDVERLIRDADLPVSVVEHKTKHMGTTHLVVLKKKNSAP